MNFLKLFFHNYKNLCPDMRSCQVCENPSLLEDLMRKQDLSLRAKEIREDAISDKDRFWKLKEWDDAFSTLIQTNPSPSQLPSYSIYPDFYAAYKTLSTQELRAIKQNKRLKTACPYERSLKSKLSKDTFETLACAVCLCTIREPTSGKCGHTFCGACVTDRVDKCPLCRDDWNSIKPVKNTIFAQLLNELGGQKPPETKITAVVYFEHADYVTGCKYFTGGPYHPKQIAPIGLDLMALADRFLSLKGSEHGYQFIKNFTKEEAVMSVDHKIIDEPEFEYDDDGSTTKKQWRMYSRIECFPDNKAYTIFRDLVKCFHGTTIKHALLIEGARTSTVTNMKSFKACADILQTCAMIREQNKKK